MSDTTTNAGVQAPARTVKPLFDKSEKPNKQAPRINLIDDVYKDSRVALIEFVKEQLGDAVEHAEFFFADVDKIIEHERNGGKVVLVNGKQQVDRGDVLMAAQKGRREKRQRAASSLARAQVKTELDVDNPDRPGVFKDED